MPIKQETHLTALEAIEAYKNAYEKVCSILSELAGFKGQTAAEWQQETINLETHCYNMIRVNPKHAIFLGIQRAHYKTYASRNFMKRKEGASIPRVSRTRERPELVLDDNFLGSEQDVRDAIKSSSKRQYEKNAFKILNGEDRPKVEPKVSEGVLKGELPGEEGIQGDSPDLSDMGFT